VPANKVRIVGGEWRSRMLKFPTVPGLRPTPDRVRETLFNWLGQRLDGKTCLDLFAGSGALGFEALSRGAKRVVMVERDRKVCQALQANASVLGASRLEIREADGVQFLALDRHAYDVIFLDPPFRKEFLPRLMPLLPAHLTPEGLVYVESEGALAVEAGWEIWRSGRAGQAYFHLLKWVDAGMAG
jgi:16S rRNA (guanine966-N2)-methyltransferase